VGLQTAPEISVKGELANQGTHIADILLMGEVGGHFCNQRLTVLPPAEDQLCFLISLHCIFLIIALKKMYGMR
jgi:hypothetical protein